LSSPVFGYIAAPPNLPTYTGTTFPPGSGGSCPNWSLPIGPISLNKREWNGTEFVFAPGTEVVNVIPAQAPPQTGNSGLCVMVIPKTSGGTQTVNVSVYVICASSIFTVEIGCVEPLPSFQASNKFDSPSDPAYCGSGATTNTFYVAKVSNDFPAPLVDINDWVFQDENGENKLEDGYYLTFNIVGPYDTIHVVNGVVVATTLECP